MNYELANGKPQFQNGLLRIKVPPKDEFGDGGGVELRFKKLIIVVKKKIRIKAMSLQFMIEKFKVGSFQQL